MDWFLYDNDLHHEKVKVSVDITHKTGFDSTFQKWFVSFPKEQLCGILHTRIKGSFLLLLKFYNSNFNLYQHQSRLLSEVSCILSIAPLGNELSFVIKWSISPPDNYPRSTRSRSNGGAKSAAWVYLKRQLH